MAEALIAAKLSRNMERPRTETDGRFLRAIRLADADGTDRQKLEAKYEHIWTAFWWFDDFKFLNDSYAAFETLALRSENVKNLDFLCNLLQILFNSVIHKHLSREECLLDQRIANLRRALEPMAADNNRPNNSLDAQTSLLIIRLSEAALDKNDAEMADIWVGFSNILEKASGLGEFDAKRLVRMVEIAGDVAGADPVYNDLIEKTAKFVADRTSEAEGALILLKRAQKLDFSSNFDMIRLLGRATIGLAKKEYADQLIESVQLLMLAYRSAGLLWAARASCVFLAASLVMEGEEDSQLPASFVPTMKIWAWIALELRHIPDFIFAIQMLNGALASLPLAEDSKKRVKKDLFELDAALGSLFLNLNEAELRKLENLPDILEGLGLFMARTALLYNLGYSELLRSDGSFPSAESDEDINRLLSTLASQPVAQALRGPLILNADGQQVLSTAIIGMTVEITLQGNLESILVAEEVLGSLEAFFATAIEQRIIPHTEKLRITVHETDTASQPTFEINKLDMTAILTWPMGVSPTSYEQQAEMQRFFMEVAGHVLATTCVLNNADGFLQKLYVDEAVHHRMLMVALAPNSYQRVTSRSLSRITDWQNTGQKSYSLSSARPKLTIVRLTNTEEVAAEDDAIGQSTEFPDMKDHRALSVRSVIDVHAWDLARWKGTGYVQFDHASPPCMAFLFENEEGARSIFGRWRERFGDQDQNEEILVSIIRQLPQQNKHHYCVQVTSKLPASAEIDPKKILMMASRSLVMEPQSDTNLEQFLTSYQQSGMFSLMPAILKSGSPPKFLPELAILKRNLSVKLAANVAENDPEAVALRIRREA